MTRSNPQQMARWLARRERHGWSWAELSERSGHPVWKLRYWQQRAVATSASKSDRSGGFVTVDTTGSVATRSTELGAIEISTPPGDPSLQGHLFLADIAAEAERLAAEHQVVATVEVPAHKRTKSKRRSEFPAHLPVLRTVCELKDEDRVCACGGELVAFGEEITRANWSASR